MGFVLSGAAGECFWELGAAGGTTLTHGVAEVALVALYFQVTMSN